MHQFRRNEHVPVFHIYCFNLLHLNFFSRNPAGQNVYFLLLDSGVVVCGISLTLVKGLFKPRRWRDHCPQLAELF